MSQDALSDLLRAVRLKGTLFFHVDCAGAWVTEAPVASVMAAAVMPGAEHVMEYHVVMAGSCWAGVVGEDPVRVNAGDVIVFPQGDAHVLSSTRGMRAEPDPDFLIGLRNLQLPFMLLQDGRHCKTIDRPVIPDTRKAGSAALLCGFLGCDRGPFNPLLSALPRMIHAPSSSLEADSWTAHLWKLATAESMEKRPGGEAVLERMSEMMFVDIVRRYLDVMPEHHTGWLAGLRDRYVGRVLNLMHESPANCWTVDLLSDRVGLSRSALHDRFVQFLQQPPMQYLTQWRMQIASRLLMEGNSKLATVALEVGYESEAAFSRAFKRTVGLSPAQWRRQRSHGAPIAIVEQAS